MHQKKSTPPGLAALLFDVDGTLADTEEVHRNAFNAAFAVAGLGWKWDESLYRELLVVTGGRERIRYFIDHYLPDFHGPDDLDGFIADLHRHKTQAYNRTLATGELSLRPGVQRLIEEARTDGLRLAIASTTTPQNVTTLLEHGFSCNVAGWFDVIAAGDVVAHKKPAPDIYHYALDRLGIPASRCLALEDSANGLHAALGAGLEALITVNRYTAHDDFTGAAGVLDQLGEPGNPCHLIAGDLDPGGMVDIAYLHRLHARCRAAVLQRVTRG